MPRHPWIEPRALLAVAKPLSAATLCVSLLLGAAKPAYAEGAAISNATKQQLKDAGREYRAGLEARKIGDNELALAKFRASYDIVASPNSLLMVAKTLTDLERLPEAYEALQQTTDKALQLATKAPKYQKTANQARAQLEELKKRIALVRIESEQSVAIDGRRIDPERWNTSLPYKPGTVTVQLRAADGTSKTESLELIAGSETAIQAAPPTKAPEAPKKTETRVVKVPVVERVPEEDTVHLRTLAYISGGVGLLGVGVFVVNGLLVSRDGYEPVGCEPNWCPEGNVDKAENYGEVTAQRETLGYVGLGTAVVGLGLGTILYLVSDPPGSNAAAAAPPHTDVAVGPGSVRLRGRF